MNAATAAGPSVQAAHIANDGLNPAKCASMRRRQRPTALYRSDNFDIRCEVRGSHRPAVTIVAADIYDAAWLLEIEVIAAL